MNEDAFKKEFYRRKKAKDDLNAKKVEAGVVLFIIFFTGTILLTFISTILEAMHINAGGYPVLILLIILAIKAKPLYKPNPEYTEAVKRYYELKDINPVLFSKLDGGFYSATMSQMNSNSRTTAEMFASTVTRSGENHSHQEFDTALRGNNNYSENSFTDPISSGLFSDFDDFAIKNVGLGHNFNKNPIKSYNSNDDSEDPIQRY